MEAAINVTLLLVGLAGALTAFIGDTIVKNPETTRRRLTRIGWISVALLVSAFALGVLKEIRSRSSETRKELKTAAAEIARRRAEAEMGSATKQLIDVTSRLATANREIQKLTSNLPVVQDEGYVDLAGQLSLAPGSERTGEQMTLYPGDVFHYFSFCPTQRYLRAAPTRGLGLLVGDRLYQLKDQSGSVGIAGPVGHPLRATLINPVGERCHLKYSIISTARNRLRLQ
jgi:hypothetical protein